MTFSILKAPYLVWIKNIKSLQRG